MDAADADFAPSRGARRVLEWAQTNGATTLGEAYDLIDQLAVSNDVPEVLGEDDSLDDVRAELEDDLGVMSADVELTALL